LEHQDSQRREETQLIALCQKGDRGAFERLYHRYAKDVYTMALRMVNSPDLAEEITQEVFISVFKNIEKFQFQSAFTTWLYRIVYRRAADQFRKLKRFREKSGVLTVEDENGAILEVRDPGDNPSENALKQERTRLIEQAMAELSPKQRAIMVLRYVHQLSYEEIAGILGCRIGTVKSRLNRAHKTMEIKLNQLDIF